MNRFPGGVQRKGIEGGNSISKGWSCEWKYIQETTLNFGTSRPHYYMGIMEERPGKVSEDGSEGVRSCVALWLY